LRFDEKPDYLFLKSKIDYLEILNDLNEKNKFSSNESFDWEDIAITDSLI
jgi:hypothetical protein